MKQKKRRMAKRRRSLRSVPVRIGASTLTVFLLLTAFPAGFVSAEGLVQSSVSLTATDTADTADEVIAADTAEHG